MLTQLLIHCLLKEEMFLGNFGGFKYMGVEVEVADVEDLQLETLRPIESTPKIKEHTYDIC